ncbi:uracil-DNA glycosylase, partial [Acinetobacter baumannii]|nr:uracil-DNA glycosylase [Acinetobacter baumannii]
EDAVIEAAPDVVAPEPVSAPAPAPEPEPAARAHTPLSAPPYRNPAPVQEDSAWDDSAAPEPAAPDVATMDWAGLRQAIAACK